jgi:hypothetical protein
MGEWWIWALGAPVVSGGLLWLRRVLTRRRAKREARELARAVRRYQ